MGSLETDAIVAFVHAVVPGVPVTAILGQYLSPQNPCSPHSPGSYHCAEGTNGKGLAVDFGGDEAARLAVFHALSPHASQLAELFHNNVAAGVTRVVKNGVWGDGLTTLGATVWTAHQNHVHVAVNRGVFLAAPPAPPPPAQEVRPMYDPPIGPIAAVWQDPDGKVIAAISPAGDVFAWGCKWQGNTSGKPYWGNRQAAQIGARPDGAPGYRIVDTAGEHYDLPDGIDHL